MASISSLGVGSNIDLQSMLTKIMAAESIPITTLGTKISNINDKISVYGSLKSKLDALRTAAETLEFPSRLAAITATSSDANVLGTTATVGAAVGQYSINVTQLASAQKDVSPAYEANTVFGAGKLTFTIAGDATTHDVDIATGDSLSKISDKINSANLGITATVISGTQGDRLILTGAKSGAGNTFSFTSTVPAPDSPTTGDPQLALQNKDATLSISAKNGEMTIDGIKVSSSTNTFANTIKGLTLNVLSEGKSTVNVKNDSDKITSAVQTFVDAYNAAVSFLKTNSAYDTTTKTGQALSGDGAVRSILGSLSSARTTTPAALASSAIKTLSGLGVSIQSNGQMSLDTTKLKNAISASASDVNATINAYGKSFGDAVSSLLDTSGTVSNRVNSLNTLLKSATASQEALGLRVANIEKRYRSQFSALDTLLSSMTTTSNYLTQQFAAKSS